MLVRSERLGIIRIQNEIPSTNVVNPTVAVVVQSIPCNLTRIAPNIQIGMRGLNPVVDHCNNDTRRATLDYVPCLRQVRVGIHSTSPLPRIV